MAIYYYGAHSITFERLRDNVRKNTWTDLHLVPTSKPYIAPAEPKFKYVNLPLSKNVLDLTRSQSSRILYGPSEGTWEFYIDHENENYNEDVEGSIHKTLVDYFDGSRFSVVLGDDIGDSRVTYYGIIKIESFTPENDFNKATLHYSLNLYGDDNEEDITSIGVIVVPQVGSSQGGDPIGKNTIIRDQLVPIVNRAKKVYYAHFDLQEGLAAGVYDIFHKNVDLFSGGGYVSDPIEVQEQFLYPSPIFGDTKYAEEFKFDIKAMWCKANAGYNKRDTVMHPVTYHGFYDKDVYVIEHMQYKDFEHYNYTTPWDKANEVFKWNDADFKEFSMRYDLDSPFLYPTEYDWYRFGGTDFTDDYTREVGDALKDNGAVDGSSTFHHIDRTLGTFPFAIAYKIISANDETMAGSYFVFGGFNKSRHIIAHYFVYDTPNTGSYGSFTVGKNIYKKDPAYLYEMLRFNPKPIETKKEGKNGKTVYSIYSDGYYATDEFNPYTFNIYGKGKINLSSVHRTVNNDKTFKKNRSIQYDEDTYKNMMKCNLSYLRDEYGLEFDMSKIYLFRQKRYGKGQYKVTIKRVL